MSYLICLFFSLSRYSILLQRTLHNELFSPGIQGLENVGTGLVDGKAKFTLRCLEYLAGSSSKLGGVIVLGMLTQLKEGKFYLEDPTGAVELDLSETIFQSGLFAENCFILAEGSYADQIFSVSAIGLPPPEEARISK